MDSNLRPYLIRKISKHTYHFRTEHGDDYKCFFISAAEYFNKYADLSKKTFSFDLELQAPFPKNKGVDKRIAATVVKIIVDFLLLKINAVVYICNPGENKGEARARKFKSWYNNFQNYSNTILHFTQDAEAGGIRLFTALLIHKDNKLRDRFIEAYLDFVKDEE